MVCKIFLLVHKMYHRQYTQIPLQGSTACLNLWEFYQWTALNWQIFEGLSQLQIARSHPCLPKVTPFPRVNSHLMTNAGAKRHGHFGPKGDKSQPCKTISASKVLVVSSKTYIYIIRGLLPLISPASSSSFHKYWTQGYSLINSLHTKLKLRVWFPGKPSYDTIPQAISSLGQYAPLLIHIVNT